jgi:sterol desaturase/sphingolipid hydroxylase (fatty acid hydroxylase superfamily)
MKEFILYLLYYDFCYYFLHRLLHTRMFYPIHKIHHKYKPSYYDFYSVHILETPITSIGLYIAIYLYNLYIYQLLLCILFIIIRGMMIHDKRFIFLVGDHHLIHHKYVKYNYGEYWIDYLFGTIYTNNSLVN